MIYPEGGGDAVEVTLSHFVVNAPWVAGAAQVGLCGQTLDIRTTPGQAAGSGILVQGDGGSGRQDLVLVSEGPAS